MLSLLIVTFEERVIASAFPSNIKSDSSITGISSTASVTSVSVSGAGVISTTLSKLSSSETSGVVLSTVSSSEVLLFAASSVSFSDASGIITSSVLSSEISGVKASSVSFSVISVSAFSVFSNNSSSTGALTMSSGLTVLSIFIGGKSSGISVYKVSLTRRCHSRVSASSTL